MLASAETAAEARKELGVESYFDEDLAEDPAAYAEYVADLHQGGLLRWGLEPKDCTAPFFVYKDDCGDKLRALFDLRPPNTNFEKPPKVRLLTAEGFTKLELEGGDELWALGYDLQDYYHYLRIPVWIASYIGLPAVPRTSWWLSSRSEGSILRSWVC